MKNLAGILTMVIGGLWTGVCLLACMARVRIEKNG